MRDLKPGDLERVKDMLAELNEMIAADRRGDAYDFDAFMQRYGDLWPEQPRNLQELLEAMARRMAAMSSLLASMTPEQRRRARSTRRRGARRSRPGLSGGSTVAVAARDRSGSPLGSSGAWMGRGFHADVWDTVDAIGARLEYDDLVEALGGDYPGATLDDVDEENSTAPWVRTRSRSAPAEGDRKSP